MPGRWGVGGADIPVCLEVRADRKVCPTSPQASCPPPTPNPFSPREGVPSMRYHLLSAFFSLTLVLSATAAPAEYPAEKLRKVLEQAKELEVTGPTLDKVAEQLSHQTGVPFAA